MANSGLAQHVFNVERRRAEREQVFYRTTLRLEGERHVPVELVNLSRTGFMARTQAALSEEMRLHIPLPVTGELSARVVWSLGGRIGAEFRNAIDPATYFTLLASLPRGD